MKTKIDDCLFEKEKSKWNTNKKFKKRKMKFIDKSREELLKKNLKWRKNYNFNEDEIDEEIE